ncbi:MAG TPA: hypothetical protein VF808_00625 [Ktedonobacterales bacterium]
MRDEGQERNRVGGEPEESLSVESLDAPDAGQDGGPSGRLRGWLTALAPARAGRPLSRRARAARVVVVVALVAATLFTLLGGPALAGVGWARLYAWMTSAAAAPPLAMTGWQTIPSAPVPPDATSYSYTPDPTNPQRVFACAADGSAVSAWVTDSGGRTWRRILEAALPHAREPACRVKIALNAPVVAIAVVSAHNPDSAGCETLTLFALTDLGSGTLALPSEPKSCLADAWPSAASLYYWWTNNSQGALALTGLERSDDLGALWHEVPIVPPNGNSSLAPALLDSGSGDTILTQVYSWSSGQRAARNELWRSLDGGNSWRRALNAPLGAQLLSTTEPEALTASGWPPTYAISFSGGELSPPWVPDWEPAAIAALQPNGSSWRALPPLPLQPATSAQRPAPLGVTRALAVGPLGDLLALGERPGAVATINFQPRQWLWAWDPALGGWRVGPEAPRGSALAGVTWASGPANTRYAKAAGMYLWLTGRVGGQFTLVWAFIPTAQP